MHTAELEVTLMSTEKTGSGSMREAEPMASGDDQHRCF